ncbi:MAG: hypothetical protein QXW39_08155 [Candidatus Bathyarchaeia archaeon]
MNMYEKMFERASATRGITVYMDELTTRKKNIFSQFLDEELKKYGKLGVYIFAKGPGQVLSVRLNKNYNPYVDVQICNVPRWWQEEEDSIQVIKSSGSIVSNEPHITYRIPYNKVRCIVVSRKVPDQDIIARSEYFVRTPPYLDTTYIYKYKQPDV